MNDSKSVVVKVESPHHGTYIIDDLYQIEMKNADKFQVYFMSDVMAENMMEPGEEHETFFAAFEQVLGYIKEQQQ